MPSIQTFHPMVLGRYFSPPKGHVDLVIGLDLKTDCSAVDVRKQVPKTHQSLTAKPPQLKLPRLTFTRLKLSRLDTRHGSSRADDTKTDQTVLQSAGLKWLCDIYFIALRLQTFGILAMTMRQMMLISGSFLFGIVSNTVCSSWDFKPSRPSSWGFKPSRSSSGYIGLALPSLHD
jgi:hypothetical protein